MRACGMRQVCHHRIFITGTHTNIYMPMIYIYANDIYIYISLARIYIIVTHIKYISLARIYIIGMHIKYHCISSIIGTHTRIPLANGECLTGANAETTTTSAWFASAA